MRSAASFSSKHFLRPNHVISDIHNSDGEEEGLLQAKLDEFSAQLSVERKSLKSVADREVLLVNKTNT